MKRGQRKTYQVEEEDEYIQEVLLKVDEIETVSSSLNF